MKKEFTRKELIHAYVEDVRVTLDLKKRKRISQSTNVLHFQLLYGAGLLHRQGVITIEKYFVLYDIIGNLIREFY